MATAKASPGELQQDVTMEPIADLGHLRFVRVLKRVVEK